MFLSMYQDADLDLIPSQAMAKPKDEDAVRILVGLEYIIERLGVKYSSPQICILAVETRACELIICAYICAACVMRT